MKQFFYKIWAFTTTMIILFFNNFKILFARDIKNPKVWEDVAWTFLTIFLFLGLITKNIFWYTYAIYIFLLGIIFRIWKNYKNDVGGWKKRYRELVGDKHK